MAQQQIDKEHMTSVTKRKVKELDHSSAMELLSEGIPFNGSGNQYFDRCNFKITQQINQEHMQPVTRRKVKMMNHPSTVELHSESSAESSESDESDESDERDERLSSTSYTELFSSDPANTSHESTSLQKGISFHGSRNQYFDRCKIKITQKINQEREDENIQLKRGNEVLKGKIISPKARNEESEKVVEQQSSIKDKIQKYQYFHTSSLSEQDSPIDEGEIPDSDDYEHQSESENEISYDSILSNYEKSMKKYLTDTVYNGAIRDRPMMLMVLRP